MEQKITNKVAYDLREIVRTQVAVQLQKSVAMWVRQDIYAHVVGSAQLSVWAIERRVSDQVTPE